MPAPVFIIAFANNASEPDRHLPALDAEFNRLNTVLGDSAKRWELVPSPKTSIRSFLDLLQVASYQNRIAMLHFAGHANGQSLLMESEEGAPEIASAAGIAEFLAQHQGLGFLFLNACSTVGQVQALLAAGVPAIIATEHDINDTVATEFSSRFYKEFVNGQTLRKAFDAASAAIKANAALKDRAQTRSIAGVGTKRDPDDWPWKLHVRDGNSSADQWSLGIALDDPLWGVPEPAERGLPEVPFRHLLPFGAEHAAIFFGRRHETRGVYDAIERGDARRVVLLHGVSGAGKSSLLEAGLLPRLIVTREVVYLRRSPDHTLLGNLQTALGVTDTTANGAGLADAWKQRETSERALTIILDQVEEALGDGKRNGKKELSELVTALKQIFDQGAPPRGSIVLGFRKEWLAEVQSELDTARLASTAIFLDRLGERGIVEAIEGVSHDAKLRAHYGLTIPDAGMSQEIAGDLVTDASSAIAPTLQVLLTKMWERADRSSGTPVFTRALYRTLVHEGVLLKDFVNQQLASIRAAMPAAEESGLVLDLLAFHATEAGDATRFRSKGERTSRYPAALQSDVARIVELASAGRLMASDFETSAVGSVGRTRLAHDTLARYVRGLATHSEKPVQRALRVLEERAPEWEAGGTQRTLDAADLKLVESGLIGMRVLSGAEQAMIAASRAEVLQAKRIRRNVRVGFALAAVLLAIVAAFAWVQGNRATLQAHRATVQALISSAATATDPLEAALMLTSLSSETVEPPGAVQAALTVLARPIPYTVLNGHTGLVTAASFSPDGQLILTASSDSTARVWQRDGSRPPIVLRGHTAWIVSAVFSPDGQHVLTAANDSTVRVWPIDGRGTPIVLRHNGPLSSAVYCPDGKWIVTAADSVVRLWPGNGVGAPVELRGHHDDVTRVLCSPNSRQVLSLSDDHTARVWPVDGTGRPFVFRGHAGVVISAAFNSSGSRIVTGADDSRAQVWNSDGRGVPVELRNGSGAGTAVAFSPNGALIALGTSGVDAQVWPASGHGKPYVLRGHNGQITSVSFTRDGLHVLTSSADGSARLWNVDSTGTPVVLAGHTGMVRSAMFSADEKWILTAGNDGTVRVWHSDTPNAALIFDGQRESMAWGEYNADGSRVVIAMGTRAEIWKSAGKSDSIAFRHEQIVNSASFSSDGGRVVTASVDESARVWNLNARHDSGAVVLSANDMNAVTSAHFSADGKMVATTSEDGIARVWSSSGGKPIAEFADHEAAVNTATFSLDGKRLVTGSDDLTARIFQLDGSVPPVVLRGFQGSVMHAAFSRDGSWLAFASDDATTRIFKGDGSGLPIVLRGHGGAVADAEFSPDGGLVITASSDATARIARRDGTGGSIVLRGHRASVTSASFSPDGKHVLTTSADGTARVWPVTWPELLARLQASTTACLRAEQRVQLLGEKPGDAKDRAIQCSAAGYR